MGSSVILPGVEVAREDHIKLRCKHDTVIYKSTYSNCTFSVFFFFWWKNNTVMQVGVSSTLQALFQEKYIWACPM